MVFYGRSPSRLTEGMTERPSTAQMSDETARRPRALTFDGVLLI